MPEGLLRSPYHQPLSRAAATSASPQTGDVAEREADQNRHQRLCVDLPRNGSGCPTRHNNHVPPPLRLLAPGLLLRFARIAHFFA
jgi:hypothetical protein